MRFHEKYHPFYSPEGEGAPNAGNAPPPPPHPLGEGDNSSGGGEVEGAGDTPAPEPAPEQHGNKGKTPWYMTRLSEEAARAREATERAEAAERRALAAEELAQRRAQGGDEPPAPRHQQEPLAGDRQAEVRREAQALRFYEDTLEVRARGDAQFGAEFADTLNILGHLGVSNNDFIGDVLAVDKAKAHEMLNTLAKDPEKAMQLSRLPSRQRIAELTRMQMAATSKTDPAPAPLAPQNGKGVSKAPAPAPRVQPSTAKEKDWRSDEASDEEFSRGFDQRMKERAARR